MVAQDFGLLLCPTRVERLCYTRTVQGCCGDSETYFRDTWVPLKKPVWGVSSPTRGGGLHLCGYGEALILLGRGLVREDHSYPVGNPSLLFCKEVQ